jgi:hypothetical protein
VFRWDGDHNVGAGSMIITDSQPSRLIRIQLQFIRPFAGTSDVQFRFEPRGDQTHVSWAMSGPMNFLSKAIGLFCNMDKMCGGSFEQGLASLKQAAEAPNSP